LKPRRVLETPSGWKCGSGKIVENYQNLCLLISFADILFIQLFLMETLLINIKSEEDKKIFLSLAKRLKLKAKFLSPHDKEDYGLLKAMIGGQTGEYVSREEVMDALKS